MDDNDVCPLCCEELDVSDRKFFPCKCGYQVCMWCWHRIRESESGLCPACRTPYGDDPHEFSAVDMEEVVKANKEKAAAEKRERERLKQQQMQLGVSSSSGVMSSASSVGSSSSHFSSSGIGHIQSCVVIDGDSVLGGNLSSSGLSLNSKPPETPRDRNQLANMRVIRRNLVYAVGLPPSIATEETLRRPEYFGQYGKISKIVLNRNHNGNGDPRRASASAYVTFAQKEDTLACILALDGFYLDGRNIRASYGTSKYCSAFIKTVRCNNPDCTYLHSMGDNDDTFSKQEIQAGYVTSGRDVLARQQQIMAAQQLSSGSGSVVARRRVGGGGPSGSGKAASNPVFPPPCFDEPNKQDRNLSGGSFGLSGVGRSVSLGQGNIGFSMAAPGMPSSTSVSNMGAGGTKITRSLSSSLPGSQAPSAAEKLSRQQEQLRKLHPQNKISSTSTPKKSTSGAASSVSTTTAASVVASGNLSSNVTLPLGLPSSHTTLTPLTPLKRSSSAPSTPNDKNSLSAKNNIHNNKLSGGNVINSNSQNPSASSFRSSEIQLPPNLPVPQGLTPAARAELLEQRKQSLADVQKQQEERLLAIRTSSGISNLPSTTLGSSGNLGLGGVSKTKVSSGNSVLAPGSMMKDTISRNNIIGGSVLFDSVAGNGGPSIRSNNAGGGSHSTSDNSPHNSSVRESFQISRRSGNTMAVGNNGFSSSLPLASGGSLRTFGNDIHTDNEKTPTSNSTKISGSINSEGNIFGVEKHTRGQQMIENSSTNFRGHRWPENEVPGFSSGGLFGNSGFGMTSGGIWGNDNATIPGSSVSSLPSTSQTSGSVNTGLPPVGATRSSLPIHSNGGGRAVGGRENLLGKNPFVNDSGSSTLASMLGIDLPTGSGSLRETNNSTQYLKSSNDKFQSSHVRSNHDSLWGVSHEKATEESNYLHSSGFASRVNISSPQGAIGSSPNRTEVINRSVGGTAIGGSVGQSSGFQSNLNYGGNSTSDIALLQSLLPGVHITSGNAPASISNVSRNPIGWKSSALPEPSMSQSNAVGRRSMNPEQLQTSGTLNTNGNTDTWGGVSGLYSGNPNVQHQPTQSSIW